MVASYGETSGFTPVAGDEVQGVNGGAVSLPVILAGSGAVSPLGATVAVIAAGILIYQSVKGKR